MPVFGQIEPPDSAGRTLDAVTVKTTDTVKAKNLTSSPFNSEVKYKAKDSIFIDVINKLVYLYGEAEVYYEKLELKAAKITLDFKTSELKAEYGTDTAGKKTGVPHFTDGGQPIDADVIRYNFRSKKAKIHNLVLKEGEGIIYGENVKKDQQDNIYVQNARYTTCDAEHPHFYIAASRLKIIPKKQIITGPANLVIADVPTPAWLPFGFFPVRQGRKSGIMMPGYGFSPNQGYFLRNGGYYFGISDYFDLALTGDVYTQGTWAGRLSSTYAKRYKYGGNLQFAYANNQFGSPEDVNGFSRSKNYNVVWNHRLDPKARPSTNFSASVNYQSPQYLQFNSYNPATIVQSQVNSSINFNKVLGRGKYNLGVNASASQNNQTKEVSITFPQLTFDVLRFNPFKRKVVIGEKRWYEDIGFNYNFNAQNRINTRDSLLFREETLRNMSNGAVHRANLSTQFKVFKYFSLSPQISANEYWSLTTQRKRWNPDSLWIETDTIRQFTRAADFSVSANVGTMLYGTFNINARKIRAIRHVMTINTNFSFNPDFSDAGFGIYRTVQADSANTKQLLYSTLGHNLIAPGPGAGRAGQIGVNLNNNLEMKVRKYSDTGYKDEKVKIFESFSISGSYNFFAEQFKLSPISMNARTVLFKQLSIMANGFTFDPYVIDSAGQAVDRYLFNEPNRKLARFTNGSITVSTTLNSSLFDGKTDARDGQPMQPGVNGLQNAALMANPYLTAYDLALLTSSGDFVDFNVPWSLTLNYSYYYRKPGHTRSISQTVMFNGDMNLTENWKIAFSSGYDFTRKEINLTSIDFHRQLHCWEFKLSWIPIGPRQYFLFTLNAKASLLQQAKINRRRDWFDAN